MLFYLETIMQLQSQLIKSFQELNSKREELDEKDKELHKKDVNEVETK